MIKLPLKTIEAIDEFVDSVHGLSSIHFDKNLAAHIVELALQNDKILATMNLVPKSEVGEPDSEIPPEQEEKREKPNCYECKYRRSIPGDTHSSCTNLTAKVVGKKYGIANGWFFWPINFDPVWLSSCTGFEKE